MRDWALWVTCKLLIGLGALLEVVEGKARAAAGWAIREGYQLSRLVSPQWQQRREEERMRRVTEEL